MQCCCRHVPIVRHDQPSSFSHTLLCAPTLHSHSSPAGASRHLFVSFRVAVKRIFWLFSGKRRPVSSLCPSGRKRRPKRRSDFFEIRYCESYWCGGWLMFGADAFHGWARWQEQLTTQRVEALSQDGCLRRSDRSLLRRSGPGAPVFFY